MAGLENHSASPSSSKSSQESLNKNMEALDVPSNSKATTSSTSKTDTDAMEDVPLMLDNESKPELLSQAPSTPTASQQPTKPTPRLDTRKSSIAAPLPWKIDETSSPYTPTSHTRKASYAPPPRASYRGSIDISSVNGAGSPRSKLPPLSTTATASSSPYAPSSPYTNTSNSSPMSRTSSNNTNNPTHDLSHPPGYTQQTHPFTDRIPTKTLTSPTYTNHSPFYANASSSTYSSSISSPLSPTQRRGRGILDNDPSIYLSGEDGEEESVWDTAAKWAKAAGKRLSAGEQTIWKMVSAMGPGDDRP
ncbi:hypothetical protein PMZ80_001307 [Knufia obscura]|uniref:Uncharacterized protein n=2 Tax=Knufia TaxID=430999 RepID=A0AAN8EL56_9EURO|nr:hypothetical protein PMZ80_001307 [Knufia obscura]KAK5956290.1 hypothetical protein OHC33_002866 [Knufia fluminis]